MKVLVTGGGGFIGRHLVDDQLRRGRQVTAVDIDTESLQPLEENPNLTIVKADFTDSDHISHHLPGHDICFHLASAHLETNVGEDYFWRVNVDGTRDFIEQCYHAGIARFVHCSSVGVFGDIKNPPADETTDCHPDIAYEQSKLAGERAVMAFAKSVGYDTVIIRPSWVYGPGCPRTHRLFQTIKKGRFFFVGDGQTSRHPIYITDMVNGFELAATQDEAAGKVFIIAGPQAVSIRELVEEIARTMDMPAPTLSLPKAVVWPAVYALELTGTTLGRSAPFTRRSLKFFTGNTAFNTKKAQELLGFHPQIELNEGLTKTYHWLIEAESA